MENVLNSKDMFKNTPSFNNGEQYENIPNLMPLLSTFDDSNKILYCPGPKFSSDLSNDDILILKTFKNKTFYTLRIQKIINNTSLKTSNNISTDLMLGQISCIKKYVSSNNPLNWNNIEIENKL